ncbi:hypothetical protein ACQW02_16085 [Humitalea sp. 24SJ18S-53]|uniref:hypothetical protein n=1 Tax=Humitalea sp. 24SJ18S-53 TaxID=3422307 RepID=UPI003D66CDD3
MRPEWRHDVARLATVWLLAVAVEVAVGAVFVQYVGRAGSAVIAVLMNLLVCLRFAVTLLPGRVPLITRYARSDAMGLPADREGYTHALTAVWAALLGAFALLHAGAIPDLWSSRAVALAQAVVCPAFFLGEHWWRSRALPELGRATPWRTLRAIRAAGG